MCGYSLVTIGNIPLSMHVSGVNIIEFCVEPPIGTLSFRIACVYFISLSVDFCICIYHFLRHKVSHQLSKSYIFFRHNFYLTIVFFAYAIYWKTFSHRKQSYWPFMLKLPHVSERVRSLVQKDVFFSLRLRHSIVELFRW